MKKSGLVLLFKT